MSITKETIKERIKDEFRYLAVVFVLWIIVVSIIMFIIKYYVFGVPIGPLK